MICVRAQMLTNNHRLLQNSPSWGQFKIMSADQGRISLTGTLYLLFIQNRVKIIARRIKINIISLVKQIFSLFIH